MWKEKMEQVAEARRGVSAVVLTGDRTRIVEVVEREGEVERRWERVKPAQPVPRMAIVCFVVEESLWFCLELE
jgi:hypothetical protein